MSNYDKRDLSKKAFCAGLMCHKKQRKFHCSGCGITCCKTCKIDSMLPKDKGKHFCINCFMEKPLEIIEVIRFYLQKDTKKQEVTENVTHEDAIKS